MKAHTRRAVAYIAGRVVSESSSSAVYDYSIGGYTNFSANISHAQISAFDYDESCYISGSLPGLYHYGNSAHLNLQLQGDQFNGYDYDTSSHFSGRVNGRSVSVYDYEHGQYFNYSI